MPAKKREKTKVQKPRVSVADLELNPQNAESGEQKPGPKGGEGRYVTTYNIAPAWPRK